MAFRSSAQPHIAFSKCTKRIHEVVLCKQNFVQIQHVEPSTPVADHAVTYKTELIAFLNEAHPGMCWNVKPNNRHPVLCCCLLHGGEARIEYDSVQCNAYLPHVVHGRKRGRGRCSHISEAWSQLTLGFFSANWSIWRTFGELTNYCNVAFFSLCANPLCFLLRFQKSCKQKIVIFTGLFFLS